MDQEEALQIFNTFLAQMEQAGGMPLAMIPRPPERLSRGWAFRYQSRSYVETGDYGELLVGHGPVVVRDDGKIIAGGSLDIDPEELLLNGPAAIRRASAHKLTDR